MVRLEACSESIALRSPIHSCSLFGIHARPLLPLTLPILAPLCAVCTGPRRYFVARATGLGLWMAQSVTGLWVGIAWILSPDSHALISHETNSGSYYNPSMLCVRGVSLCVKCAPCLSYLLYLREQAARQLCSHSVAMRSLLGKGIFV